MNPSPPNLDTTTLQAFLTMRELLRQELQPIADRMERFEAKLDKFDDLYYRKDYVDQRLKPLEDSALSRNQRMGVLVSGAFGLVATLVNIFSFIVHLPK